MNKDRNTGKSKAKKGLKMKELVEATGLAKSTLLYYVSLGLISEPVKTSPNMAYYDVSCIDRVRFIQNMRHRHRLSLSEIKDLIDQWDEKAPISTHVELTELVFGPSKQTGRVSRKQFLQATRLTDRQLKSLLEAKLLLPLEKNHFDQEDVVMGRVLAQGLGWGYTVDDFAFYVNTGEEIVNQELEMRKKLTQQLPLVEDAAVTLEMVKSARVTRAYVVDRLFQHRVSKMKGLKDEAQHSEK